MIVSGAKYVTGLGASLVLICWTHSSTSFWCKVWGVGLLYLIQWQIVHIQNCHSYCERARTLTHAHTHIFKTQAQGLSSVKFRFVFYSRVKLFLLSFKRHVVISNLSLEIKNNFVKNCICSVALCGSETLTRGKNEERVVNAFETWCWRRMLKVKWA